MTNYNYESVVRAINDTYPDSANAYDAINNAGLTPEEFYQASSNKVIDIGIKYRVNGDGDVNSIFNNYSTNLSDGNVAQSAINSNMQTGTASESVNVQYAAESSVNQSGKVELSAGVTKYKTGQLAPTTGFKAVVGSVASGVAAYAVGVSAGKKLSSFVYSRNPAFFDSIGLSTLDPATWKTITSDMSDTGVEGALKTAFNFLLGLNEDGSTQAYLSADAYKYLLYGLAQSGMFDSAGEYVCPKPTGNYDWYFTSDGIALPQQVVLTNITSTVGLSQIVYTMVDPNGFLCPIQYVYNGTKYQRIYGICSATAAPNNKVRIEIYKADGTLKERYHIAMDQSCYQIRLADGSYYYPPSDLLTGNALSESGDLSPFNVTTSSAISQPGLTATMAYYVKLYGTPSSTVPGVENQSGATIPDINSTSSQQDVSDAVDNQLSNLHDNRITQNVVQPDGTVKQIIYYPVPIPTNTTDTTTTEAKTITIDQPIRVILPNGAEIILPDGTRIVGDGVSVITLPPGTYTLPSGTKVLGNPVADPEGNPGDTQANPQVEDSSTDVGKDLIRDAITQPTPAPTPSPDSQTQNDPEPTNPNPSDTGDGITPVAPIPTGSASALFTVYNPSLSEINSLGAWLWSSNFIDQLLKMFNDPMQAIIGLHKTFISPNVSGRGNIRVGYLDSGVAANLVPTQYSTVECGSVSLPEYFGNVFDYAPYTRVYIYLPFVGFRELDVSQVMRSTISVKYHGDAYTGTGLAEVKVTRDSGAGGVLYTYGCECAVRYPLSQGSYMGFASAVASLAVGIASGNVAPALLGFSHGSSRPSVEHSGSFSGNSGAMGIKKPYLVVMRPQTAMAKNFRHYSGNPSNSLVKISSTSGLIRVRECHVDSIPYATKEEKAIIDTALHDGIIV